MTNYPTYKLGELISEAIGGDWGKAPDFLDESYELAYCIRGAEYKNWADDNGSTAVLRKIKYTNLQKRQLKEGDIIVEISGGGPEQPVGRTEVITKRVLSNFKGSKVLCTNFLRLIRPNAELVDAFFLNYYLKFFYSTGEIIKYQAGSNNLRNLKFKDYLNLPIPLPPLATQRAIVTRIETLFAELDKAVLHLRTAQQQLKTYRQVVLNHWLNNDEGKWETVNISCFLDNSCKGMMTGPFGTALKKSEHKSCGVPVLGIENIGEGSFVMPNKIFVTKEKAEELKTFAVKTDDIIISRSGTVGEICKVPLFMNDALLSTNLIRIRLNLDLINADYFVLLFQSSQIKQQVKDLCKGTTRAFLNQTILNQISFPFPPLAEQQRIVKEIESRLSQAEAAEASIAEALQKTEALRQSILKKAFSGELV